MATMDVVSLPFEAVDDLIYDARAGDLESLKADITKFSQEYDCSPADIIKAAIDTEDESEGGTGSCLLHWPAANGNAGTWCSAYPSIPLNQSLTPTL